MHGVELFLGLLALVAALAGVARAADVPYPVVGLVGGLAIGVIPGLATPRLDPDLVFLLFLPPLLYSSAFLMPAAELRAHARPIALLAVGLVLLTLGAVGVVAHAALDVPWPVAFVLGAILAPTDPVAAVTVLRRLGAPADLTSVLEGEALVNDGTSLTAYKVALAAVGGSFSLLSSTGRFFLVGLGGVAIGIVAGYVSIWLRRRVRDAQIEITLTLLTPFLAYIPAERVGASGVLAAVAAGVLVGARSLELSPASTRVRTRGFWEVLTFLLESSLFLLVGLQVPHVVSELDVSAGRLIAEIAAVSATVIAVRFAWVAVAARRPWPEKVVEGLSGIRGAISVAAALALPLDIPHRDLLIAVTTGVVLVTLVPPSLGLPWIAARLGVVDDDHGRAEDEARLAILHAGLKRIEEAAETGRVPEAVIANLRDRYEWRVQRLEGVLGDEDREEDGEHSRAARALREAIVDAEQDALEEMVRTRRIEPRVADEIRQDLDVEGTRVEGPLRG